MPFDWDDLITKEGWAVMSEEAEQAILKIMSEEQACLRSLSSAGGGSNPDLPIHKRKSDDGCDVVGNENAKTKMINPPPRVMDLRIADDSSSLSRDIGQSDTLVWVKNYEMHISEKTALGPMRHATHHPSPMLQILDVFVKCYYKRDGIAGTYYDVLPDNTFCPDMKMDVYGTVAVRDPLDDYSRSYIFNRPRENAQTINADGGYLCLRSSARGISAVDCLIEIDIKIKASEVG